jgi:AcrR family transcriptional regulator
LSLAENQLGEVGPVGLSLRAVARDAGMVSSAVYRYFATRDDLLTALIIRGYDDLGQALRTADRRVGRADLRGRLTAIMEEERAWARANPHRWALLYGTPVPGYQAPEDTVDPATAFFALFSDLMVVALGEGRTAGPGAVDAPPETVASAIAWAQENLAAGRTEPRWTLEGPPTWAVAEGIAAWSWMLGSISAELWGHYVGTVDDVDAVYRAGIDAACARLGL